MQLGEADFLAESDGFGKFFFRFAGKTDDHIGGKGGQRPCRAKTGRCLTELLGVVTAFHPPQHRVTATLQGQMKLGAHRRTF